MRPTHAMIMNVDNNMRSNMRLIAAAIGCVVLLCGAQFGLTIAANEASKEVKSNHEGNTANTVMTDKEGAPVATGKQVMTVDLLRMHMWTAEHLNEVEELYLSLPLVQEPKEANDWMQLKLNVNSYLLHPNDGTPVLVVATSHGDVIICDRGLAFESPDEFLSKALSMVPGHQAMMDDGSLGGLVANRRHLMGAAERKLTWLPLLYYGAMCAANPACVAVGLAVLQAGVNYCCVHAPPPPPGGMGLGGDYVAWDYFNPVTEAENGDEQSAGEGERP